MSNTPTTPETPEAPTTLNKFLRSLAALIGGALTMFLAKQFKIELPVEIGNGIVDLINMALAGGVAWVIARIFPKK